MSEHLQAKRRIYWFLSWAIVVLYILLNIGIMSEGVPAQVLIITLPIITIVTIALWLFVRTLYNIVNQKLKRQSEIAQLPVDRPTPKYGDENGSVTYVPNVKIDTGLFDAIHTDPTKSVTLDITLEDYVKTGRVIIFHDKADFGRFIKVEVVNAVVNEQGIEANFLVAD